MSTFVRRIVVLAAVVVALGVGAVAIVLVRSAAGEQRAAISFVQTVEADVEGELDATWARFGQQFDARMTCLDDVNVELVSWIRDADSAYLAGSGRIEIRAPVEPDRFRELLARGLAEHVAYTCDDHADLDAALGASAARFPDAVAELVADVDTEVERDVLDLVARWGTGAALD